MNMKKYVVVFMIAVLLPLIWGCTDSNEYFELKMETDNLSETMQNYLKDPSPNHKGSAFQVKVNDIYAVPYENGSKRITYYRYSLLIAPVTDEPIEIHSMKIQPVDKKIQDYLNGYTAVLGLGDLHEWNSLTNDMVSFVFRDVEEMIAYRWEVTFNDLGEDTLQNSEITAEELEQGIRNFEIVVEYNRKKEVIPIQNAELRSVSSDQDEVLMKRADIAKLYEKGSAYSVMEPYR